MEDCTDKEIIVWHEALPGEDSELERSGTQGSRGGPYSIPCRSRASIEDAFTGRITKTQTLELSANSSNGRYHLRNSCRILDIDAVPFS